eukprot:g39476.t1
MFARAKFVGMGDAGIPQPSNFCSSATWNSLPALVPNEVPDQVYELTGHVAAAQDIGEPTYGILRSICSPCSRKDVVKLERVQKRFTRLLPRTNRLLTEFRCIIKEERQLTLRSTKEFKFHHLPWSDLNLDPQN